MQRVAQDWLVLSDLTDSSGVAVGVVTALQFAPVLALSAWAGLLATGSRAVGSSWPPRARWGCSRSASARSCCPGTSSCGTSTCSPARRRLGVRQPRAPDVRRRDGARRELSNAVGLNSASFNAARLVGPGVAGLLIAAVGSGWLFIINGVTFGATILALLYMRTRELHVLPSAPREKGQIREGIRYVRGRTDIIVIMVVVGVVSTFGLNFQLTSAMMAKVEFGMGPGEYGILGSILAIGSLTGALLAARRERPRVRLVIGSAFGFAVATGVMALMPTNASFAVACIPVGLASLTMMTAANSTIQMSVDPVMRGRVMSLYMIVFLGATPVGSPLVGWIAEAWGPRWAIGVGSITAALVAVGAAVWAVRNWHLEVRYRVLQRPHLVVRYLDACTPTDRSARAETRRRLEAEDAQEAARAA